MKILTCSLSAIALSVSVPTIAKQRPNIILIFTDQQTVTAMSCAGNPALSTPNMDALAADGIRFTNAYCTSPVSGPSRATIVSGLMPSQIDMDWNDNSRLSEDVETVGEILSESGYKSVWAGKWHIPEMYPIKTMDGELNMHGFDFLPFWDDPHRSWILGANTDPPLTEAVVKYIDGYKSNERSPLLLAVSYHNPHDICMYPRKVGWESEDNRLLDIRPFGLYELPHPMGIEPSTISTLPSLPLNFNAIYGEPEFVMDKRIKSNPYGDEVQLAASFSELEWRGYLNAYYRLTELVDIEVGKIIEALKRNGMYDNSLIIFTSDHGDGVAAHRWAAKLSFYEESVKVPFLMVLPKGERKGVVNSSLVTLADIVPTMCDYAGAKSDVAFVGESLRGVTSLESESQREFIVVELADDLKDKSRKGRMVRSQRYMYSIYSQGQRNEQLFDLLFDPGQTHNLAYESDYREVVVEHRKMLEGWLKDKGDEFKIVVNEK